MEDDMYDEFLLESLLDDLVSSDVVNDDELPS